MYIENCNHNIKIAMWYHITIAIILILWLSSQRDEDNSNDNSNLKLTVASCFPEIRSWEQSSGSATEYQSKNIRGCGPVGILSKNFHPKTDVL